MSALGGLKVHQLRILLTQIGSKTTGNKSQLITRLQRDLTHNPRRRKEHGTHPQRILSVDMGIKNLAFCVAEIPQTKPSTMDHEIPSTPPPMHIKTWQRISLLSQPKPPNPNQTTSANTETPAAQPPNDEENDTYTPSALSTTALGLVKNILLPHKPSTILIERQRFRSANAAAVQEWTLRVNLLEGMIWAILRALGHGDGGVMGVESVSPARVAGFWVQGTGTGTGTGKGKGKGKGRVEKGDKIGVVGRWLEDEVGVRFEGEAERVREAFLGKCRGVVKEKKKVPMVELDAARRERGGEGERRVEDIGKLDDLADCLLQAAAWVKWRGNRRVLAEMLGDEKAVMDFIQKCETG